MHPLQFDDSKTIGRMKKLFRYLKIRRIINQVAKENKELFDRLDDYDENGIPYWERTGVVDPDYDPKNS